MLKGLMLFSLAGAAISVVPSAPRETVVPMTRGAVHGTIDVVSFGVAQLSVDERPISALHVRETFANRGDNVPWTLELASSTVAIRGEQDRHPILLNSDLRTLPIGLVGRGERRIVDLYFAMPSGEPPDAFVFTYRLNTPDHHFLGKVELGKSERTAGVAEWLPPLGWAKSWWADPAFAWPGYAHRRGTLVPRSPSEITLLRAPHTLYEAKPTSDEEWPRTDECNDW